jgi:hypothetical protein
MKRFRGAGKRIRAPKKRNGCTTPGLALWHSINPFRKMLMNNEAINNEEIIESMRKGINRARRVAQRSLEIANCVDPDELLPDAKEEFYDIRSSMREIVRVTEPDFLKKMENRVRRLDRPLSVGEILALLGELDFES